MGCAAARPCPRSRARAGASTGQRHFRAYRGWYPMPGPTHDVHAAGIVEETGRSWVGGPAYSGFSVAFAHHAKEVTQATLDRCANPTSRGVSMSGETPGIAVLRTPTRWGALPPGPPRIFSKQRRHGAVVTNFSLLAHPLSGCWRSGAARPASCAGRRAGSVARPCADVAPG